MAKKERNFEVVKVSIPLRLGTTSLRKMEAYARLKCQFLLG